jgi:uncharacterized protein YutE (UPF0331/DUF86 family)
MDKERIDTYLQAIAVETAAIDDVLKNSDEDLLASPHLLKSCKYSLIVISEAIANTLQHILAKKYQTAVNGYTEVFIKAKNVRLLSNDMFERLQPFIRFRNLLVHQYWRIEDTVFLNNLRAGLSDFKGFIHDIRKIID